MPCPASCVKSVYGCEVRRGFLLRLEAGCRKMTQALWCEEIRTYIRHLGCILLVPRYKLMCRKNL